MEVEQDVFKADLILLLLIGKPILHKEVSHDAAKRHFPNEFIGVVSC
jgi:hypothetical protein